MNPIGWLWYHLTAYVPRRIPATPAQYERMKRVMVRFYGVPDDAPVWALVAGQLSSQHAFKLRVAWGSIANSAKRIEINNLAQAQRKIALGELNKRLEEATLRHSTLMQGVNKLLDEFPPLMRGALEGDERAVEQLAEEAAERFPEQGASSEQWMTFIRSQAIHKNVAQANQEAANDSKDTQELKAQDAEPSPRAGQATPAKGQSAVPPEALGKRGGKAERGPKGTA